MLALGVGIGLLKRERELPAGLAFGLLALKVQWLPILVVVAGFAILVIFSGTAAAPFIYTLF